MTVLQVKLLNTQATFHEFILMIAHVVQNGWPTK